MTIILRIKQKCKCFFKKIFKNLLIFCKQIISLWLSLENCSEITSKSHIFSKNSFFLLIFIHLIAQSGGSSLITFKKVVSKHFHNPNKKSRKNHFSFCFFALFYSIFQFSAINIALHGEPSKFAIFKGAQFRKYRPSATPSRTIPSSKTTSFESKILCTDIGAFSGPTL